MPGGADVQTAQETNNLNVYSPSEWLAETSLSAPAGPTRSRWITSDLKGMKDQLCLNLLTSHAHGSAVRVILGLECFLTALWVTQI